MENDEIGMETPPEGPPTRRGCAGPLKCCGVIAIALLVVMAALIIYAFRMPGIRELRTCQEHMLAISSAITRYNSVNNEYPPDLSALSKDFLPDPKVLTCPGLNVPPGQSPFIYRRPEAKSPGSFEMLICECNKLNSQIPVRRMVITKGGGMKIERISFREAVEEQERRQKTEAPKD